MRQGTVRATTIREDDPRIRVLIDATYDLLDAKGIEGLTVRAVLARSGLARRAFYECFETKDELLLAVFECTLRDAAIRFAEAFASQHTALDRLRLIVSGIVLGRSGSEGHRRSAALTREHLRLAEARPFELQRAVAPLIDLISRQLTAGMLQGVVRRADPHLLATLVYNLVSTTMHTELMAEQAATPNRARREQLVDEIWQFCERAIMA